MDFGSVVSELRKQKKISQTDLASQLGIHKNVLGRYERNEVFPSIDIARKIADILEVSLEEFEKMTKKIEVEYEFKTNDVKLNMSTATQKVFKTLDKNREKV